MRPLGTWLGMRVMGLATKILGIGEGAHAADDGALIGGRHREYL